MQLCPLRKGKGARWPQRSRRRVRTSAVRAWSVESAAGGGLGRLGASHL